MMAVGVCKGPNLDCDVARQIGDFSSGGTALRQGKGDFLEIRFARCSRLYGQDVIMVRLCHGKVPQRAEKKLSGGDERVEKGEKGAPGDVKDSKGSRRCVFA